MAFPDPVHGLLRLVHIGSAVIWIGFLWYGAFVLGPTMRSLPQDAQRQVGPRLTRAVIPWLTWSSALTVLAGLGLYSSLASAGVVDTLSPLIHLGATIAIGMLIVGHALVLPTLRKVARTLDGGTPPKPERLKRVQAMARVNAVLGALVLVMMALANWVDL